MHLLDTTMFFCARSGGVKRYLLSKRDWLQRHAPTVRHSLLVPAPQRFEEGVHACAGVTLELVDGYRLPLDPLSWYRAIVALEPDVIEAADPYVPGWAARLAAARLGVPSVAFYHSDLPRMLSGRVGRWISPLARSYLRQLYGGFDLVLAPSTVMLERLLEAGVQHARVQPLGVDVASFHPNAGDPTLRARLGLPSHARLLVYAGRFAKEKNLDVLQAAVRKLGDPYHLLLIGGRRRTRVDARVTVLPYQRSTERLARLLASCDVFVHAGDQETYGLVAAEAMACGVPVVGVAQGAIPELVDDAVGALAKSVSANALAEAIDGIFARDLSALRQSARARAATSYAWDFVFRSILGRYMTLLSAGSRVSQRPIAARL